MTSNSQETPAQPLKVVEVVLVGETNKGEDKLPLRLLFVWFLRMLGLLNRRGRLLGVIARDFDAGGVGGERERGKEREFLR